MPSGQKIFAVTTSAAIAYLTGPLTCSVFAAPVTKATATGRMSGDITTVSASMLTKATATGTMSGKVCQASAAPRTFATATGAMSGRLCEVSARPTTYAVAEGSLLGKVTWVSAAPLTYATATAQIAGRVVEVTAFPATRCTATATLTGASDARGMSYCDVIDEVLAMWGIFCRKSAPSFAIDRATNDINTALQLVWNNAEGRSYWSNDTITITLSDGESSQDLPDDIQNVVGPCRRYDNRRPLVPIGTIGELETFADLYLDSDSADEPLAYHIERTNQLGANPGKCVFHVVPQVTGDDVGFLLEIIRESPRFVPFDLTSCPIIPIPHRYVESLLLPIARYQASSFYLFRMEDKKPTIDREYQQAMVSLGLADPLPGKAGDNKERRDA